jgi:hypothetical protein
MLEQTAYCVIICIATMVSSLLTLTLLVVSLFGVVSSLSSSPNVMNTTCTSSSQCDEANECWTSWCDSEFGCQRSRVDCVPCTPDPGRSIIVDIAVIIDLSLFDAVDGTPSGNKDGVCAIIERFSSGLMTNYTPVSNACKSSSVRCWILVN